MSQIEHNGKLAKTFPILVLWSYTQHNTRSAAKITT